MSLSQDTLVQTEGLPESVAFYEVLLGLHSVIERDNLSGLEAGAFRLLVDRGKALGPVLDFFVPDLQKARSALLAAGCRLQAEDPTSAQCHLCDPYGLCFNLAQGRG